MGSTVLVVLHRDVHGGLEASKLAGREHAWTNCNHGQTSRKQCWGVFRHKGGDFPAGPISPPNARTHGHERGRGPWRPGACIEADVLILSSRLCSRCPWGRSGSERPGGAELHEHHRDVDGSHGGREAPSGSRVPPVPLLSRATAAGRTGDSSGSRGRSSRRQGLDGARTASSSRPCSMPRPVARCPPVPPVPLHSRRRATSPRLCSMPCTLSSCILAPSNVGTSCQTITRSL
jgi:hypothetical protein